MAFVPITFVADELLTSTKMNLMAANQAGFNDGTGLGDGIIVTRHVGTSAQLQLGSYSTSEQATRYKWIDGKVVYKKTIAFGVNSTSVTTIIPHSIISIGAVVDMEIQMLNAISGQKASWFAHPSWNVGARVDDANIYLNREISQAKDSSGHITIYYTKV